MGGRDLVLLVVPVVLLGVYAVPEPIRREWVFSYVEPTATTAFTSHFVHLGAEHLAVNLASYLLLAPTAYALSTLSGRRGAFLKGSCCSTSWRPSPSPG